MVVGMTTSERLFTCRNCDFFDKNHGVLRGGGLCRRRSGTWPAVYETDWCGEHRYNGDPVKIEVKSDPDALVKAMGRVAEEANHDE